MLQTEAIVIREVKGTWAVEPVQLRDETLQPSEVLVEVKASGICHSDLSCCDGTIPWPLPTVLGHEGAGIVKAVGPHVKKVKPGDSVITTWAACRLCDFCSDGHPALCDSWQRLNVTAARSDGSDAFVDQKGEKLFSSLLGQSSFARHQIVDESSCIKVPSDAPLADLAPYGCSAITGAGTVLNAVQPRAGRSLVVFGVGAVGASAIMAAAATPCSKIIAVDLHQTRLDMALKLGATNIVKGGPGIDVAAEIKRLTGSGADYAVECTGATVCVTQGNDCLRKGGKLFLVGLPKHGTRLDFSFYDIFDNCKSVQGVIEGDCIPDQLIPFLVELNRRGKFDFGKLCKKYSYKDANQAVHDMVSGAVIKPILLWD